jgi:two-component system response regulator NreC
MTRPRVLIADDQQPILDWLDQQLRDEFQIVAACTDGSTALETAIALQPDALVLDISMPQMSGLDVARRLSALPHPPRIVFLSVHEDRDFQEAATAAGGSGYVIKRNLCTHLVAALRRALSN